MQRKLPQDAPLRFLCPLDHSCLWPRAEVQSRWERLPGGTQGHEGEGTPAPPLPLSIFTLLPSAQCEMSEWSLWGPCSKKKKLCGFRRGLEERTRRVLQAPGGDHAICSDTKETRRCTVRRTPCPEGELPPRLPGVGGQHNHGRTDHLCFLHVAHERASGQGPMGRPQLRTPRCAGPCQAPSSPGSCVVWQEASVALSLQFPHFF